MDDDESLPPDVLLTASVTTLGEVHVRDSASLFVPAKLMAFEERLYTRTSRGCGVVLIWTK